MRLLNMKKDADAGDEKYSKTRSEIKCDVEGIKYFQRCREVYLKSKNIL